MGLFCMNQPAHILLSNYIISLILQNASIFIDFAEKLTDNTDINDHNQKEFFL